MDELHLLASPLAPLEGEHDDLIDTLDAFLQQNGYAEATATQLGIHRHTMRNRVHRIIDLIGGDLDSADRCAELLLAIKG